MKKIVFSFLLFFACTYLQAQVVAKAPDSKMSSEVDSRNDTITALHKLFSKRSSGAHFNFGTTSYIFTLPSIALLALESNPAGIIAVGASIGIGIGKAVRFSPKKEEALINSYQNNQPLPDKMRKRLKPKFFK